MEHDPGAHKQGRTGGSQGEGDGKGKVPLETNVDEDRARDNRCIVEESTKGRYFAYLMHGDDRCTEERSVTT